MKETLTESRKLFRADLLSKVIAQPLNHPDSPRWEGPFWGIHFFHLSGDTVNQVIELAISKYDQMSDWDRYNFWFAAKVAAPETLKDTLKSLFLEEKVSKVAVAAAQLFLEDTTLLMRRFDADTSIYAVLLRSQIAGGEAASQPEIYKYFLENPFFKGKKHIFCFQFQDRDQPGFSIVADSSGQIVSNEEGEWLRFADLARSASNNPYYLTNGNTPAGVYSIQGFGQSDNVFIGPSTNIQTRLPYEEKPSLFFHNEVSDTIWNENIYRSLIPDHASASLMQSYVAGKLGRTEIIMHGSTIDTSFYKSAPFYPLTPSLGCITALELWDPSTGRIAKSDQQRLVETYQSAPGKHGYLVVIELSKE